MIKKQEKQKIINKIIYSKKNILFNIICVLLFNHYSSLPSSFEQPSFS